MISSPARPESGCGAERGEDDEPIFAADQVAIQYIDEQLHKARRSLRRTRVFCIIIAFLVLGYMSVVTITIRNRLLRPDAAAEMAVYYITRFAAQNGWAPSANVGEPSRGSVAPVSDSHAMTPAGNPERPAAETIPSANTDPLAVQAQVAAYVRRFISQPHGNLQDLMREAQHPKTVQQLSDELDQEIRERLPSRVRYGFANPDYMSYVDQKLATLTQLESQFDRLAHANDLTPYEKTLRHIIASTMGNSHEGS